MPAPRMFSTTGSALSSDEIAFAQQVAASFSFATKRSALKLVRRVDSLTGAVVEYHADKDIAYVTPGGATDYVQMLMPNPVPYRGVSIGTVDAYSYSDVTTSSGLHGTSVVPGVLVTRTLSVNGVIVGTGTYDSYSDSFGGGALHSWFVYNNFYIGGGLVQNGTFNLDQLNGFAFPPPPDATPEPNNGITNRVTTSDGIVLASEVQTTVGRNLQNPDSGHTYYVPDTLWNGEGFVDMCVDSVSPSNLHHQMTFTVPEDCIHPAPVTYSAAFNTRRKEWLKKNSDEFIAALKTGFAVGTPGVTRPELQLGRLPEAWEYQIKLDVDAQYNSYTPANTIGRKTHRDILYSEAAYSETVESDTSANLTQAGVKVTKRVATLQYTFDAIVREVVLTGFLTQTVTRHNDSSGTQLNTSWRGVYDNWYNRESTSLPSGVPSTVAAPYLKDRTTSRIGVVLNGVVQTGYNADSSLGAPGNPLEFAAATPIYPAAYSTVTATTPDFVTTWHADTKIIYAADGTGASNALNDSALYGVTKVELTPVGLIANGVGTAAAGESVGIFSAAEDGTQVEIYGTAVYNFDWQTGELMFANWKALHGDNGLEVDSKTVDLPQGILWADEAVNCLVTYRGLHWPDVVSALRVRDGMLPTSTSDSDRVLYTLINAAKAG